MGQFEFLIASQLFYHILFSLRLTIHRRIARSHKNSKNHCPKRLNFSISTKSTQSMLSLTQSATQNAEKFFFPFLPLSEIQFIFIALQFWSGCKMQEKKISAFALLENVRCLWRDAWTKRNRIERRAAAAAARQKKMTREIIALKMHLNKNNDNNNVNCIRCISVLAHLHAACCCPTVRSKWEIPFVSWRCDRTSPRCTSKSRKTNTNKKWKRKIWKRKTFSAHAANESRNHKFFFVIFIVLSCHPDADTERKSTNKLSKNPFFSIFDRKEWKRKNIWGYRWRWRPHSAIVRQRQNNKIHCCARNAGGIFV